MASLTFPHAYALGSRNRHRRCRRSFVLLNALASAMVAMAGETVDIAKRTACRARLTARVYVIGHEPSGYPQKARTCVAIRLTNISKHPVYVTSMFVLWQLPFWCRSNVCLAVNECGDRTAQQPNFPLTLLPHTSEFVCLIDIRTFRMEISKVLDSGWWGRTFAAKLLKGTLETDDGGRVRLTSDNSVRIALAQLADRPAQVGQPEPPTDNAGT